MSRVRSFRLAACLVAVATLVAAPARADEEPTPDQIKYAAEEFNAGAKSFRSGNFVEAAEHYENSFREVPTKPSVLRAAIQNRVKAKQKARAATLAAIAVAKFASDAPTVALAKEVLASSEKSLAKVNVTCSEPCAVFIDSVTTPYKPTKQAVLYVEPGAHTIAASWGEKRNESKKVDGAAGGTLELSFKPPTVTVPPAVASADKPAEAPPPVVEAPKAVEHKPLPRWAFFTAAGVTTVLVGVTVWSTIDMRSNPGKAKVERDCVDLGSACPTFQDALSAQKRTNVFLGVSAGALVATGVLGVFFTDFHPADSAPATAARAPRRTITPVVSPFGGADRGMSVGAYGTF